MANDILLYDEFNKRLYRGNEIPGSQDLPATAEIQKEEVQPDAFVSGEQVSTAPGPGQIPEIDENGALPAVSGENLTNIFATGKTNTTQVVVANTTTETNLLSNTIIGNILGTNNGVKGKIYIYDYDDSTSFGATIRLKLGSITITSLSINSISGGNYKGYIEFFIANAGATNSQKGWLEAFLTQDQTNVSNVNFTIQRQFGTSSEDTTVDKTLAITLQHATASSSITITTEMYELFYIKQS